MTKPSAQASVAWPACNVFALLPVVLLSLLLAACDGAKDRKDAAGGAPAGDDAVVSALVRAEETCLRLSGRMNALSKGLMKLRLPDPLEWGPLTNGDSLARGPFAPEVTVVDLGDFPVGDLPVGQYGTSGSTSALELRAWPVARDSQKVKEVNLWRPLLDAVESFEYARVFVIDGEHPNGDGYRFEANGGFEGLAKMKSGEWRSLNGKMKLSWERLKGTSPLSKGEGMEWRITGWKTERMEYIASPRRLFVEALDTAMRGPEGPSGRALAVAKLRRSLHYEASVKHYRDGMKALPHPYFAPISANQKEGLAVADINRDGFDDIYITVRLGTNMLLINQRDGTFKEDAAAHGLALPGHTTCALFADFDNDGDLDAMLGRSLLRTTYLENRGGKFFQYPIPKFMPMAAISMAAADYNKDGLLDVYVCTYRPAAPAGASPAGGVAQVKDGDFDWPDEFLSPEQAREFRQRLAEHRKVKGGTVLDQIGPPNVLLINSGHGRFEVAPENETLGLWRNSLQATWGDYDQDGDADLFVANDWAPSNLFRNDGATSVAATTVAGSSGGAIVFKDVTEEAGTTAYGFSMGASWGDYDNDGLEDVYVSNMYSAAGRRMTTRIPGLSGMFVESAAGNWLYRQTAVGKFQQVAGMEPPAMTVMNAGWSWGGCFVDFDNDRFLDLYVLNGYFTAPQELSSDMDVESNLWRTMLRTDQNLARASFRFSPEWKRTPAPDNLGPQIDARLSGVERQGDKVFVHSLNGNERNRYFANRGGRSFLDISGVTGLDNPADSRGFAVLDYDRDGWQDVALVNANQPLFNLYHNEMAAAGLSGGMIAVRFIGGNRTPDASTEFACRDGYGARVKVDLGDTKLIREYRCGDGWSTQNSPTMIIGIGAHTNVASITVQWPSGKTASAKGIPEGTLLTIYENRADSPSKTAFLGSHYRMKARAVGGVPGN